MDTSAKTDQIHDASKDTTRVTGIGSLRRSMAGALLATALGATAVGLTATNYPDDAPATGTDIATPAPAPAASALRWLTGFIDRAFDPHVECDYRFDDRFPCDWR
jgi:hypothetical protein